MVVEESRYVINGAPNRMGALLIFWPTWGSDQKAQVSTESIMTEIMNLETVAGPHGQNRELTREKSS